MPIDPVCKMQVDEDTAPGHALYNNADYYFCSKACEQKFTHDPGAYLDTKVA